MPRPSDRIRLPPIDAEVFGLPHYMSRDDYVEYLHADSDRMRIEAEHETMSGTISDVVSGLEYWIEKHDNPRTFASEETLADGMRDAVEALKEALPKEDSKPG